MRWPWLAGSLALHLAVAALVFGLADRSRPAEPPAAPALEVDIAAGEPSTDVALPSAPLPVAALPAPAPAPPDPMPAMQPPPQPAEPTPVTTPPARQVPRPTPRRQERRVGPSAPVAASLPQVPSATAAAAASTGPQANWDDLVSAWIAAHRSYPDTARRRGDTGEVTLRFAVAADGRVTAVTVVEAAGARDLTEAAVALLTGATLPPPQVPTVRTVRLRYRLEN